MQDTLEYQTAAAEEEVAALGECADTCLKEAESGSTPRSIDHCTEDHTAASKELDAIMDYLDKLKPQFETQVTSIEERKARREAEFEGLKEALAVLDGTLVPAL